MTIISKKIYLDDYPELADTFQLVEINGPYPGSYTTIDYLHFNSVDNRFLSYSNACVVPNNGINYSYAKSFVFKLTNWKKFSSILNCNKIFNVGCYSDLKSIPEGVNLHVPIMLGSDHGISEYKQAKGIIGLTGEDIRNSYTVCDFIPTYNKSRTYIIDSNVYNDNFMSKICLMQVSIQSFAEPSEVSFDKIHFVCNII